MAIEAPLVLVSFSDRFETWLQDHPPVPVEGKQAFTAWEPEQIINVLEGRDSNQRPLAESVRNIVDLAMQPIFSMNAMFRPLYVAISHHLLSPRYH